MTVEKINKTKHTLSQFRCNIHMEDNIIYIIINISDQCCLKRTITEQRCSCTFGEFFSHFLYISQIKQEKQT